MANVTLRNIIKTFGDVEILKGIDLKISDGELLVLVGPSGCGKSTLLRTIAGLEEVSSGDIVIGERRVNNLTPSDRDIAMVFQSYALYPHMTAEGNMGFALEMAKTPKAEIARRVDHAAGILDLKPLLKRKPSQLSGGQRQRVAMGRAIVRDPQVFLFDEPLSNLDAKLRVTMRSEIKALHRRLKATMIYVTHDQIEAMTMADRIVVMDGGVISQVGAPLELYDTPANLFVAAFIGSPAMNFLPGRLERAGTGVAVRVDGSPTTFAVPDLQASSALEIICGIRPEHFRISGESDGHAMKCTVVDIEPTGAELQILLDVDGFRVAAVLRERLSMSAGDVLYLAPDLDRISIFDKASGRRLPRTGEKPVTAPFHRPVAAAI